MLYEQAKGVAKSIDKNLSALHFKPSSMVEIEHEDGSCFKFCSAFMQQCEYDPNWLFIFTEHHEFFVFSKEDLVSYFST